MDREMLTAAIQALTEAQRKGVELLTTEARGYAFGWQDAHGSRDDAAVWAFVEEYTLHCWDHFANGLMRSSIHAAWRGYIEREAASNGG